ncbi:hypothetical protein Lepil_0386 [Leptonema illini DSM 21528]|uniref:Uncharacterized protein n=1 Tax=Leptonema illini DSM 21528 TaxID=929563 RepID=H2CKN7_9LEPT|nr:hypothetical protein Lepil_0386 [Leptonema illini DSM 21528]
MRQFVQNRLQVFEALTLSLLLVVFLIPVGPVMLLEIPGSTGLSVTDDLRPRLDLGVPVTESNSAVNDRISGSLSSSTSWELTEEEVIIELYVAHYDAKSKQHAEASISSSRPSRQGFEGQKASVTGISSGSSGGLVVGFIDRGAMWLVGIRQIFNPTEAGRNSILSLSYYSIRQGYSNPDVADKISVIAKVRGFSV